jgi:hypothetical protein
MPSNAASIPPNPPTLSRRIEPPVSQRGGRWHYFFVALAVLYTILAIVGFTPSFVSGPPIPLIAYVHAALMAAWLAVFFTQTRLAAAGDLSQHRAIGRIAAWFAVAIWISMIVAAVTGHIRHHPDLDSFLYDILMVEIALIVLFAVFFVWGLLARHQAGWHRRLMALSTLMLVQAGLDRMGWQPLPGPMLVWLLLIPFFVFDIAMTRRVHPVTLIGTALIVATHLTILVSWGSPAWHEFAQRAFSHIQ